MSQALSAARAASDLGWTAREPSFLDGVERYLAEWRTSG
jgi:nucleoside-diphosphate-sugar epimerase